MGVIAGVILAGGGATRFGGIPKGLERVGGQRIIDRVAAALAPSTDRLIIASNDPAASDWIPGADVARDVLTGRSSVIGIHGALRHARSAIVVIAWDMPFVTDAFVQELARRVALGAPAVVPIGPYGVEGVCAAYGPAALPVIEGLAAASEFRISALIDALPAADRMTLAETGRFGDPERLFFNVNTPDDRRRAEVLAAAD